MSVTPPEDAGPDVGQRLRIAGVAALLLIAGGLSVATVLVGTNVDSDGNTNPLAASLLQMMTFIFSLGASAYLGKIATEKAAERQVRRHVKPAFRRVLTLYGALGRINSQADLELKNLLVKQDADGLIDASLASAGFDKLRLMTAEQIKTGGDAMEDWRDLAPVEVAAVQAAAGYEPGTAESTSAELEEEVTQ